MAVFVRFQHHSSRWQVPELEEATDVAAHQGGDGGGGDVVGGDGGGWRNVVAETKGHDIGGVRTKDKRRSGGRFSFFTG